MTDPGPPPPRAGRRRGPGFARIARVLVLWTVAWWTVLGVILHPWVPGGWATLAVLVAAELTVPLAVFARAMDGRLYPGAAIRLLVFRPFWYLQLAVPLLAGAGLIGAGTGLLFGAARTGGAVAAAGAAVLIGAGALAGWIGSRLLVTRRLEARFPDLPAGLEGLRIVQLSDLHVGPHTSRRHLRRACRAARDAEPDLVVFTGDMVDDYARDTEPFGRAFGRLRAPLGVYAVPGNHDVYAGWGAVRRGLEDLGIRVLVNRAVAVDRDGHTLWLAGTGDPAGRSFRAPGGDGPAPDVDRTLAGVPPGAFVVGLAHNPVLWPALADRGVPLTLSGHTHHGQLSVPKLDWSLASVFLEHAMGVHGRGGALLYISPGTNHWGLPFRIGALPEVTVLTLRRGAGPALAPEPPARTAPA